MKKHFQNKVFVITAIILILVIAFAVYYFFIMPRYKYEECTIKIIHQKGQLYEKMKQECRIIHVLDNRGKEIETIKQ